jgi:hypothetical protein
VSELLLLDLFDFIDKPFERASRRNDSVVRGYKSHQKCSPWTFYPLLVKRDLWHWMLRLRQRISEYSFFLPSWGLGTVWWKLTVFLSHLRNHCQFSDWQSISFNRRPRHDKLKTYCKSVPELLLLDLFEFIEKRFEMASRRNDSVVKGANSHQNCSAWTFYPLLV